MKKIFGEFYSRGRKPLLVTAVFSFYSAYQLSILNSSDCSVFEYALLGMSDHYYFVFFFLAVYAVSIAGSIQDSPAFVMLRNGRYSFYFIKKAAALSLFTVSIVLLHAGIVLLIGSFHHAWDNRFTNDLSAFGSLSELIRPYSDSFRTPLAALAASCLYLSLGLCVSSSALILLSHKLPDRVVILLEICAYLIIIVTLHRNIDRAFPFLFLNNYLFLHRAIGYGMPVVYASLSVMSSGVLMFLANRQRWKTVRRMADVFSPMRIFGEILSVKNILTLLMVLTVLSVLNILKFRTDADSGLGFIVTAFWGYGLGYFNMIAFLQVTILNGIPLYILAAYLGNRSAMRTIVMIRYGHVRKWFLRLQGSMLTLIAYQMAGLCLSTFALASIADCFGAFSQNGIGSGLFTAQGQRFLWEAGDSLCLILAGVGLRILELMFLQMVFLVVLSIVKTTTLAYLATMFLYLLVVLSDGKYIPFGLSSLCRILELSKHGLLANSARSAAVFIGCYTGMYVYLAKYGTVRILNEERKGR
jgi:hypothetical protein